VPPPKDREPLAVTDFRRIARDRAPLKSSQLTVPAELVPEGGESIDVPIEVDTTGVEPGLYVGNLLVGSGQSPQRFPAHVYVSKAQTSG
ncbi:MAG: hypothetical protein QOD01_969, partial [Actinomycetota bacterium]|jgi:hypothetical protein|nr:hypothetical protein [Actinomycetota bacterium]